MTEQEWQFWSEERKRVTDADLSPSEPKLEPAPKDPIDLTLPYRQTTEIGDVVATDEGVEARAIMELPFDGYSSESGFGVPLPWIAAL